MVKIRLSRSGGKKRPFYHIVVSDARSSRGGHYIERLGLYNPVATGNEEKLRIDREKIDAWIQKGAQPTEVVSKLLKAASA